MCKRIVKVLDNLRESDRARKMLEYDRVIFNQLLVTFILILITEAIWPMSVSSNIHLNHFLMVTIISGIPSNPTLAISILGSLIIWSEIGSFGITGAFICILSGILIYLLSNIMVKE